MWVFPVLLGLLWLFVPILNYPSLLVKIDLGLGVFKMEEVSTDSNSQNKFLLPGKSIEVSDCDEEIPKEGKLFHCLCLVMLFLLCTKKSWKNVG